MSTIYPGRSLPSDLMIKWMNSGKTNAHATRQEEIDEMLKNVLWLKVDSPVLSPPQPDLPTWPKEKDIKGALYELNYCGEYDHADPANIISSIPVEQPYFYYGIDPTECADVYVLYPNQPQAYDSTKAHESGEKWSLTYRPYESSQYWSLGIYPDWTIPDSRFDSINKYIINP